MTIYLAAFPASVNTRPPKSHDTIVTEASLQSGVTHRLVANTFVFRMWR